MMKQLVVLSGKGGTGKTSVAAALSHLAAESGDQISLVLADADVDAANLELILAPRRLERTEFWAGQVAAIDPLICSGCGECARVCRFEAVVESKGEYSVDSIACEGCAACSYVCPMEAISMQDQLAGEWYHSTCRYGPLFHAALHPAQENSGKLVTLIKQQARLLALDEGYDGVLVDGPPGIGCPVISAASGADLALIVAEPSMTGVHDMRRILQTTEHFEIRSIVCINKSDIYPEGASEIESYCQDQGVEIVGAIPFDLEVTRAMAHGEPVTVFHPDGRASWALKALWERVAYLLREHER